MDCYIGNIVMINITTFTVNKDDGTKQTVTIEPVLIELPEAKHFTGVYRLTDTDLTGKELGEVAFHLYNVGEWEFTGDAFSCAEQDQIVEFIKEKEPFDSIAFSEIVDGTEHHYRITDNEGHFGIEKDGIFIGVIEHNEDWEQIAGDPLPGELFEKLVSKIESFND